MDYDAQSNIIITVNFSLLLSCMRRRVLQGDETCGTVKLTLYLFFVVICIVLFLFLCSLVIV